MFLPRGFEEDGAEFFAGTATGLDCVAVGAERDHLGRVVGTAEGQVVYVVDLQNRFPRVGAVLDVTRATRVFASSAAAKKDGTTGVQIGVARVQVPQR